VVSNNFAVNDFVYFLAPLSLPLTPRNPFSFLSPRQLRCQAGLLAKRVSDAISQSRASSLVKGFEKEAPAWPAKRSPAPLLYLIRSFPLVSPSGLPSGSLPHTCPGAWLCISVSSVVSNHFAINDFANLRPLLFSCKFVCFVVKPLCGDSSPALSLRDTPLRFPP